MLSMLALLEVACPLATFGGSMRPCAHKGFSCTYYGLSTGKTGWKACERGYTKVDEKDYPRLLYLPLQV